MHQSDVFARSRFTRSMEIDQRLHLIAALSLIEACSIDTLNHPACPRDNRNMNRSCLNILYSVVLVSGAIGNVVNAADVPQWSPHDFSFHTTAATNNPFMVSFSATVKGPDGNEFTASRLL